MILLSVTATAHAAVWDESLNGDLSNDGNAPTPLTFNLGTNVVSGTMGSDLPHIPPDRDIFTFTLQPGQALTSIVFTVFTPTNQSFYAVAPGSTIDTTSGSTHLSNTLVKRTGENILDDLARGSYSASSLGLTAPLTAGTYTIWFQEFSSVVTYSTTYTVTPVPEPSAYAIALPLGLAALIALRRRRAPAGA